MNELTQQGIAALKSGDRAAAFQKLSAAVRQNPNDLTAWLWLSGAVDKEQAQIDCLRQVLRIDPGNTAAARGLAKILDHRTRPETFNTTQTVDVSESAPQRTTHTSAQQAPAQPASVAPVVEGVESPDSPGHAAQPGVHQPAVQTSDRSPQAVLVGDLREDLQAYEQPLSDQLEVEDQPLLDQSAPEDGTQEMPVIDLYRPAPHIELSYSNFDKRIVFKTRPSHVPALISFWILFVGSAYTSNLLSQDFKTSALFAVGLGLVLEAAVIFTVIVNFKTYYELTDESLHMHIVSLQSVSMVGLQARDIIIPVEDIYATELEQNFLQQLLGIANLRVDAVIEGRLGSVYMRGIPQGANRSRQIMYLVNESRYTS